MEPPWSDDSHEWTSCEMYGHDVTDGRCTDCGEEFEED